MFWANFRLPLNHKANDIKLRKQNDISSLEAHHQIDLSAYSGKQDKRKIGRNLVHYDTGKAIFAAALGMYKSKNTNQQTIF